MYDFVTIHGRLQDAAIVLYHGTPDDPDPDPDQATDNVSQPAEHENQEEQMF